MALPWRLRWLPVCASTETELDRWLAAGAAAPGRDRPPPDPRPWSAGPGLAVAGGWGVAECRSALAPALPNGAPQAAPTLAVTLGLALQLEALGLQPQIKWPNDLLLNGRKLAGVLPRLRWRGGRLLGCRVGIGLNGCNPVPAGAIALASLDSPAAPAALTARVLRALEWAVAAAGQADLVRRQAERRLWCQGPIWHAGVAWEVAGLNADGSLRLQRDGQLVDLRRDF